MTAPKQIAVAINLAANARTGLEFVSVTFVFTIGFLCFDLLVGFLTEVVRKIWREVTRKVGVAALNRLLAKAFGVEVLKR